MKAKQYKEMTAKEQLDYVLELVDFTEEKLSRLKALGSAWTADDRKNMEAGLRLLLAFPFSQDFANKGLLYGDLSARVQRIDIYLEKIKDEVARGTAVRTTDGQTLAYIPTMQQQFRKRGRPSKEDVAAMARTAVTSSDIAMRKQQAIARLLGAEIVTNQQLREKNNDELAEERRERKEVYDKQNPSLFQPAAAVPAASPAGSVPTGLPSGEQPTIPPTLESLSETRLHLDQIRFLLSPTLQERVDTVRELRNKQSIAAETAKRLALEGKPAEVVQPYAQQAADATEQYEAIYADVDREMATVFYRLQNDGPYREKFEKRFNIKDLTDILKKLRPYFQKMPKEFEVSVRLLIEQESPEYVAKMKAEEEKKKEVQDILRYLRRKDKAASKQRVETSKAKYARLVELLGKKEAEAYQPLVTAIEEQYKADSDKVSE